MTQTQIWQHHPENKTAIRIINTLKEGEMRSLGWKCKTMSVFVKPRELSQLPIQKSKSLTGKYHVSLLELLKAANR